MRRPIPDLPLIISIANATERDELLLKEVKLLGPWRNLIRSFAFERALKPVGKNFARLGVLREEMERVMRRAAFEGRITLQQKETLSRIQEERTQLFYEIGAESAHTRATFDTTPYLKEVGDEATITIQASFTHNGRPLTVERTFTYTRAPSLPDPTGWSRGDFHIHSVFSDSGDIIVGRLDPLSIRAVADRARTARANDLCAIAITDHDDDIAWRDTRDGTDYHSDPDHYPDPHHSNVTARNVRREVGNAEGWVKLENPAWAVYNLSLPEAAPAPFYLEIVYESETIGVVGAQVTVWNWTINDWEVPDGHGLIIGGRLDPNTYENFAKFTVEGNHISGGKVRVKIETFLGNTTYIRYVEIERPKPAKTKPISGDWPGLNEGTWAGYKRDIEWADTNIPGITVIPGVEFGRDEGHFLAYDLTWFKELTSSGCPPDPPCPGCPNCPGQHTINHVNNVLDSFGYIAHPLGGAWPARDKDWDNWNVAGFTGIEVWNAGCHWLDVIADEKWDELLQKGKKVFGIGNSDSHHLRSIGEIFNFTRVTEGKTPEESIIKALREGNVIFGKGPFLNFEIVGYKFPECYPLPPHPPYPPEWPMWQEGHPKRKGVGETARLSEEANYAIFRVEWEDLGQPHGVNGIREVVIDSDKIRRDVDWFVGPTGYQYIWVPINEKTICIRLEGIEGELIPGVFTNPIWIEFPYKRPQFDVSFLPADITIGAGIVHVTSKIEITNPGGGIVKWKTEEICGLTPVPGLPPPDGALDLHVSPLSGETATTETDIITVRTSVAVPPVQRTYRGQMFLRPREYPCGLPGYRQHQCEEWPEWEGCGCLPTYLYTMDVTITPPDRTATDEIMTPVS